MLYHNVIICIVRYEHKVGLRTNLIETLSIKILSTFKAWISEKGCSMNIKTHPYYKPKLIIWASLDSRAILQSKLPVSLPAQRHLRGEVAYATLAVLKQLCVWLSQKLIHIFQRPVLIDSCTCGIVTFH
jgi:hypothetical protein